MRKIILYICSCSYYFLVLFIPFADLYFFLLLFSLSLKGFNISCSVDLLVMNSFNFSKSEKSLYFNLYF